MKKLMLIIALALFMAVAVAQVEPVPVRYEYCTIYCPITGISQKKREFMMNTSDSTVNYLVLLDENKYPVKSIPKAFEVMTDNDWIYVEVLTGGVPIFIFKRKKK